ncbi:putative copper homeostasis protein cutC-like isoform X3 [Apostichopus japonicus]|uniref:Copper homeostasis protein cutC homolog n=1 Tax=Stichopus japonicus TaxID=307972 RepID=A0A2G8LQK7_STIJA|nr:putative copper homeostasis protein cutC-like isoform X3 [Apostichopus japonicus]
MGRCTFRNLGLLQVIKGRCKIPVFVLIRPRGGDFRYSDLEIQVMRQDIQIFKAHKADGFVIGALSSTAIINFPRQLIVKYSTVRCMSIFLAAFDMCQDPFIAMETIICLGFERILTSGQESSVLEGAPLIRSLVEKAHNRIIIMPGGGINDRNLERILKETNAEEFHCSARSSKNSEMQYQKSSVYMGGVLRAPEFITKSTDAGMVQRMKEMLDKR